MQRRNTRHLVQMIYILLRAACLLLTTCMLTSCQSPFSTGNNRNVISANNVGVGANSINRDVDRKIDASSRRCVNTLSSANIPGTSNGRLACAWAVNRVVFYGTGQEVGGGLSTANMSTLLHAGRGREVDLEHAPAGAIIISPTVGPIIGHVGILMDGFGPSRRIYSNSSTHALYMDNFTVKTWKAYYVNEKKLKLEVYQINE